MKELEEEFKEILTKAYNQSVDEFDLPNQFEEGEESINFFKKTEKEVLDFIFSDKVRDMRNVKIATSRSYSYFKRRSNKFGDSDLINDGEKHTHLIDSGYQEELLDEYVISRGEDSFTIYISKTPRINEDSYSEYSIYIFSDTTNLEFVLENDWNFDLRHYQE